MLLSRLGQKLGCVSARMRILTFQNFATKDTQCTEVQQHMGLQSALIHQLCPWLSISSGLMLSNENWILVDGRSRLPWLTIHITQFSLKEVTQICLSSCEAISTSSGKVAY